MLYDLVSFMNTATHDDDYSRMKVEEDIPMSDNTCLANDGSMKSRRLRSCDKGGYNPFPDDDGSVRLFLLYDFLPRRSAEKLIHTPAIWESDDPAGCFQSDQIRICTYLSWGFDRGLYDLETLIKGYDVNTNLTENDLNKIVKSNHFYEYLGNDLFNILRYYRFRTEGIYSGCSPNQAELPVKKLPVNADDIVADSRRKIKKEDIILAELAKSGEAADSANYLVFTETALYQFVNHKIQNIIRYEEIEDADFTDDSVSVTTQDKNCVNIEVGPSSDIKEKSPRILFNLLMDIKERVEKKTTA